MRYRWIPYTLPQSRMFTHFYPPPSAHGQFNQRLNAQLSPCQSVLSAPNPSTDGAVGTIDGFAEAHSSAGKGSAQDLRTRGRWFD